jgi:hypothetical protein
MFNEKAKLVKAGTTGVDERVDEIITNPESPLALLYAKCEQYKRSLLKRSYIEASLMCSQDLAKIHSLLEIGEDVLEVYSYFFFDVVGMDRLAKIEHIESVKDDNERQMKLWALGQGLGFIEWRLGYKVSINPVEGLVELFNTCMYKSKESIYSSSTSETSKEAVKWTKMSTDIARLLKLWTSSNEGAKDALTLAIREIVPEFMGIDELLEENMLNHE